METVIGLNLNHHNICLFTKTAGGEGLPGLNKFLNETLQDAVNLVALRLEDRKLRGCWNYLVVSLRFVRGISVRNYERLLAHNERDTI